METTSTALADALSVAHRSLHEDLRKLTDAVRPETAVGRDKLLERLQAARIDIMEHFRFEETNGYMDGVQKREPRLKSAIDRLLVEHAQLQGTLDELIAAVERGGPPDQAARQKVLNWIEQVRAHEIRENDLVQDAFNQDLGAED